MTEIQDKSQLKPVWPHYALKIETMKCYADVFAECCREETKL